MLEFPDVVSVEIFRPNRTRLAIAGDRNLAPTAAPDFDRITASGGLDSENDRIWSFTAAVVSSITEEDPFAVGRDQTVLGYVRLNLSKESLNQIKPDVTKNRLA